DGSPINRAMTKDAETIPIAALRRGLQGYFAGERLRHVLRRMREAMLLPAGAPGRGGARSAEIDVRQAALILIALAVPADPIEAPAEAGRIGRFGLRAYDHTHGSDPRPGRRSID